MAKLCLMFHRSVSVLVDEHGTEYMICQSEVTLGIIRGFSDKLHLAAKYKQPNISTTIGDVVINYCLGVILNTARFLCNKNILFIGKTSKMKREKCSYKRK